MWTFTYGKKLLFMENIKICDIFRANYLKRIFLQWIWKAHAMALLVMQKRWEKYKIQGRLFDAF